MSNNSIMSAKLAILYIKKELIAEKILYSRYLEIFFLMIYSFQKLKCLDF